MLFRRPTNWDNGPRSGQAHANLRTHIPADVRDDMHFVTRAVSAAGRSRSLSGDDDVVYVRERTARAIGPRDELREGERGREEGANETKDQKDKHNTRERFGTAGTKTAILRARRNTQRGAEGIRRETMS